MKSIFKAFLVLTCYSSLTRSYNVDVVEYGCNSSHPEIIEIMGKVVTSSRGVFGITGIADIKKDIDILTTKMEVRIYYSANGITYVLSPFRIPLQTLENALNNPYKKYVMEGIQECCTNVPVAEVFVNPLTKRRIECELCSYPSDNFPTGLRPGYYRIVCSITGVPTFAMWVLLKLDED